MIVRVYDEDALAGSLSVSALMLEATTSNVAAFLCGAVVGDEVVLADARSLRPGYAAIERRAVVMRRQLQLRFRGEHELSLIVKVLDT